MCRCCGAVLPSQTVERLDEIRGLEHAKRALEVATVGGHTLVLEGVSNRRDAERLAQVARSAFQVTAFVIDPCACGNYGAVAMPCTCTPTVIARFRKRAEFRRAVEHGEIFVQVPEVPYEKLSSTRKGEPDEAIYERIAQAQARPMVSIELIDPAAQRLMQAAVRQLHLDAVAHEWVRQIAATIARLSYDAGGSIRPAHLAEAIQYRPRFL
jgi:predicted ATPase with chaperone activity